MLFGYVKNRINFLLHNQRLIFVLKILALVIHILTLPTQFNLIVTSLVSKINKMSLLSTLKNQVVEALQLKLSLFDEVVLLMSQRDLSSFFVGLIYVAHFFLLLKLIE